MQDYLDLTDMLPPRKKNNTYKLKDEIDGVYVYFCASLNKYKIVDHIKGLEVIYTFMDI